MARELTPATTLGAYGAGLALVFVAALGVGRAVGPVGVAEQAPHGGKDSTSTHSTGTTHGAGSAEPSETAGQDR